MYTAHRNLHPDRKKTEGNPCEESIVYNFETKNRYTVVRVDRNVNMEVVKIYVRLAVSEDAKVSRWLLEDFWKYFTTRENNLKQTL
jgi:hypothetical protein